MISANKLDNNILSYKIDGELNDKDFEVFTSMLSVMSLKQKSVVLYGEITNFTNWDMIKKYFSNHKLRQPFKSKLRKYIIVCDKEVQELLKSLNAFYLKNIKIEFFTFDQRALALQAAHS